MEVRSFAELRLWWNTIIDVRVKAIVITGFVFIFTVGGFQYQIGAQTGARIDAICQTRRESRQDLHDVLYEIVDLSDVLPGVEEAEEYTKNRREFIDARYSVEGLNAAGCD